MSTDYFKAKFSTLGCFESLKVNTLSHKVTCHAIRENQKVDIPITIKNYQLGPQNTIRYTVKRLSMLFRHFAQSIVDGTV